MEVALSLIVSLELVGIPSNSLRGATYLKLKLLFVFLIVLTHLLGLVKIWRTNIQTLDLYRCGCHFPMRILNELSSLKGENAFSFINDN